MRKSDRKSDRDRREERPVHYWQSMADVVSCTLLIFILLASIAAFSSWHDGDRAADTSSSVTADSGQSDVGPYHADNSKTRDGNGWNGNENAGGNGQSASGGGGQNSGGGQQTEEAGPGNTSAVQVKIVDQDSGEVVQEAGVRFALYTSDSREMVLHTYYPELVSYEQFETEQDGSFYLPEKLSAGSYFLHELTAAKGYGLSADIPFQVEEGHDWSDPIVVNVELGEATGVLQLHLTDEDTGDPVAGVSFQVIAAEDLDASRVKSGDVCAELVTDAQGNATSDPLYLGNYQIRQTTVSDAYALPDSTSLVTVKESTPEQPQQVELKAAKTRVTLTLTKQGQGTPLAGAVFTLSDSSGSEIDTYQTDEQGKIEISPLAKNTAYQLTETTAPDGYLPAEDPVSFTVDGNGHINGKTSAAFAVENAAVKKTWTEIVWQNLPFPPIVLLFAGIGALLIAAVLLYRSARRRKKKHKDRRVDGMDRR
ncbi:MSCRAMM family protein [Porcincola sp. LCP21S3_C12]|uniref:MSCRAMM family protein n=1 Tax=Porcincola sp. LCP21S3_C12 TaxID=3438798 RepID=UPI003F9AEA0D